MGSLVLRVEGDSLQMVGFRVKVWVTCIVFLSNGIFRSQSRAQCFMGKDLNFVYILLVGLIARSFS